MSLGNAPRTFGVGLPLGSPVPELVEIAIEAERLGYRTLWANDDRLYRDVYTVLSAMAVSTEEILVGPGVTNPYSRHPIQTAMAIASLDEISEGRAVLGLGAGGTGLPPLGIDREAPVQALREAVSVIRRLLNSERVSLEGRVIRAIEAKLDFVPPNPAVPIFIGARGPKILALAGEIADGAIIGNLATVEGWKYAMSQLKEGADRVGKDMDTFSLIAWLYASIHEDPEKAMAAIRPMVATSLITSRSILDRIGIRMPAAFGAQMDGVNWSLEEGIVARASKHVPGEIVRSFGLAGTSAMLISDLEDLLAEMPTISQIVIVPLAAEGLSSREVIRRMKREVFDHVMN